MPSVALLKILELRADDFFVALQEEVIVRTRPVPHRADCQGGNHEHVERLVEEAGNAYDCDLCLF